LVTPLRDGMNLVAKEFVAAKRDSPGVLILSEMAGVAAELKEALIINPNDVDEIEAALLEAMLMPEAEQKKRMLKMQRTVSKQSVNKWANDFVTELAEIKKKNLILQNKKIDDESLKQIKELYQKGKKRLLILDYDGTLVPIVKTPELAIPEEQLIQTLKTLAADKNNTVVISSGRDADFLDKWFGELGLNLAAEHGAYYKVHGKWHGNFATKFPEDVELSNIMQRIVDKTPGSRLELKKTSMVWHYRNCDKWLADLREKQLINALMMPCARLNLQIMRGTKVVEVKTAGFNKGTEAIRLTDKDDYDFVLAMGDDNTDEDMFHVLSAEAITIKVGSISDRARFSLPQKETNNFLNSLMPEIKRKEKFSLKNQFFRILRGLKNP